MTTIDVAWGDYNTPDVPSSGFKEPIKSEQRSVLNAMDTAITTAQETADKAISSKKEPFGQSGVRVLVGQEFDQHYGWGGWAQVTTTKRVYVWRQAAGHSTDNDGEVWAADSIDNGQTLTNHRKLGDNAGVSDMRVQKPRMLANDRFAFLVNRMAEDGTDYDPILFYSDDDGVTFSQKTLTRPGGASAYSFDAHGGIIDFPTSQGGDDDEGFIAFGFISAGGYGYLSTTDNFDTYSWQTTTVAEPEGDVTALSEVVQISLGSDRWLCYARCQDSGGWRDEAACWKTTDLTDWGSIVSSGISLGGNPPAGFYDSTTDKVHLFVPSRGGRFVDSSNYDNWLMHVVADADELWAANGDFSSLSSGAVDIEPFMPLPYWGTFYGDAKKVGDHWNMTFTCAEDGEAGTPGNTAVIAQIGDFIPTGVDRTVWQFMFNRRIFGRSAQLRATSNDTDNYPLEIMNSSDTARIEIGAYGTEANFDYTLDINGDYTIVTDRILLGTTSAYTSDALLHILVAGSSKGAITTRVEASSSKKHLYFQNTNGEVGSISTSGTATAFNTSSDENWKIFKGDYSPEEALKIIKSDPVREFDWIEEKGGGAAIGWGAQTSFKVSPDLATEGGWFDADGNECDEKTNGAKYMPWGVDQSKRTPYLWAAVSGLADIVEKQKRDIEALKKAIK